MCYNDIFRLSVLHCRASSALIFALIFLPFTHFHCSITIAQISCTCKIIGKGQGKPEKVVPMGVSIMIRFKSKIQLLKCVFPVVVLCVGFKLVDFKLFLCI